MLWPLYTFTENWVLTCYVKLLYLFCSTRRKSLRDYKYYRKVIYFSHPLDIQALPFSLLNRAEPPPLNPSSPLTFSKSFPPCCKIFLKQQIFSFCFLHGFLSRFHSLFLLDPWPNILTTFCFCTVIASFIIIFLYL